MPVGQSLGPPPQPAVSASAEACSLPAAQHAQSQPEQPQAAAAGTSIPQADGAVDDPQAEPQQHAQASQAPASSAADEAKPGAQPSDEALSEHAEMQHTPAIMAHVQPAAGTIAECPIPAAAEAAAISHGVSQCRGAL